MKKSILIALATITLFACNPNKNETTSTTDDAGMSDFKENSKVILDGFENFSKNDLSKFDAQLIAQTDQFNSQQDFARASWNAQNSAAVEASNVSWRRQANTINTAAQNQINAQNAQNAFGMSMQSQSFLWQELRDQADFDFRAGENELNRQAQILSTAIANEGKAGEKYDDYLASLINTLGGSYRTGLTSGSTGGGNSSSGNQRK